MSDDDSGPEEVSINVTKEQAIAKRKSELRNQIEVNTQVNLKKRKREEALQKRRSAVLPTTVLEAYAEQEKKQDDVEKSKQEPPKKKKKISKPKVITKKIDKGIKVTTITDNYKQSVKQQIQMANEFLNQSNGRVPRKKHSSAF